MGANRFTLIKNLIRKYDGQTFHIDKLKNIIRINLASTDNIVTSYMRLLNEAGLIIEVRPWYFKIDCEALKYDAGLGADIEIEKEEKNDITKK